jgi:hypothetical protein
VRTLVLQPENGMLGWTLLRDHGLRIGDEGVSPTAADVAALDALVADLASGRGATSVNRLAAYAVRYVLVTAVDDVPLADVLDSLPGLSRVSSPGAVALWRLETPVSRLRLVDSSGAVVGRPASGQVDATTQIASAFVRRTLVQADPASSGWRATLSGTVLTGEHVDGWAQGFPVPHRGGTVHLDYQNSLQQKLLWMQGILLAALVVLALPGRRRHDVDPEVSP